MLYRRVLCRPRRLLFTRTTETRGALVRAVWDAKSPFRAHVRSSPKHYRRHPKHRVRALAEAVIC